jgi:hypothetical protein
MFDGKENPSEDTLLTATRTIIPGVSNIPKLRETWLSHKCTTITGLENFTTPRLWRWTTPEDYLQVLASESARPCQWSWKKINAAINLNFVMMWFTFTSPEKAACVLAKVFSEERWYAESKWDLVSFIFRDCYGGAADVEGFTRSSS